MKQEDAEGKKKKSKSTCAPRIKTAQSHQAPHKILEATI
jgi:hypothetical protein